MFKKGNLYYPNKEFQKRAVIKDKRIYQKAMKDPVKFWEGLAKELFWFRAWKKGFEQKSLCFQWFRGGRINIAVNIFEKNPAGWNKIKNKPALIWQPEPVDQSSKILTYEDLSKEVNKLANGLRRLGVKKGDRVGIYLPMIPEVIISMLACAKIGAVHSVVFSAFSSNALRARLQDTGAVILITADGYWRRGKIIALKDKAAEGLKETRIKKVIVVKRARNKIPWNKTRDLWWQNLIEKEDDRCQAEEMNSEDLLFVLYTSGSTGKPKGCEHVCGGYTVQAYWTGKWILDFQEDSILWCTSDPGWITGHSYAVYSPLLNGITTFMFEGALDWPVPDRWAQIIEKHGVTIFYTAPTAVRMFERHGARMLKKYKFKTLRLLGSVGEPIDEAAWNWYFKEVGRGLCPIVDTWWQTETGGILITSLPGIGPFRPGFAGLPFPGVKVDIFDAQGKSLPSNKEGNLVILPPFPPGLLRGIYKNPKKYKETYWKQYGRESYFTSDAAYEDKQGLIRIVGRVDDVIKAAGHRLTSGELEAAVNLHPQITECAAIGVPDEIKGEAPVVFAVIKSDAAPNGGTPGAKEEIKKQIISYVKKEIGPIALPKEIYLVNDLPKTRSGKIMRRILRRLFTGEELGDLSALANPEIVEDIRNKLNI